MTSRRDFLLQATSAVAFASLLPEAVRAAAPAQLKAPATLAVIGCGRQGRAIIAELQKIEGVKIAAVCDTSEPRVKAAAGRAAGAATYADYREALDRHKDATAVIVATPTHLHKDIAIACVQAGRHVYCEAPLAHTAEDAKAIVAAARGASTVFHAGFQARSNPVYSLARSFFRGDALRQVVALRAQNNQKNALRYPVSDPAQDKVVNWHLDPAVSLGLPGEIGAHQFDVFHWFLGKYPSSVRGTGAVLVHKDGRELADTVHLDMEFEGGGGGVNLAYSATLANSYEDKYEMLYGEMAAIRLAWSHGWMFKESDAPTQGWEVYANRQRFHNDEGITLIAGATKLAEQGKLKEGVGLPYSSLYYALADFLKSVTEAAPVACSADEGYRGTVVAIAAARAVTTGDIVKIDPDSLRA